VNVEDVWVDVQKNWYVPLDQFLEAPNPFIAEKGDPSQPGAKQWWDMFKYQAISRGKAAPDRLNYCSATTWSRRAFSITRRFSGRLGWSPARLGRVYRRSQEDKSCGAHAAVDAFGIVQ